MAFRGARLFFKYGILKLTTVRYFQKNLNSAPNFQGSRLGGLTFSFLFLTTFLLYRQFHNRAADSIIRKALGIGIPSVTELVKNTSIIFINQHYSLSGAKPLSPAVIEIGGIHIKDAQPLDEVILEL